MIKRRYTNEFKLSVVKDYYDSPLGVPAIASKYNIPSKNYIKQRETQLKKKGLLPPDATKPKKTTGRTKNTTLYEDEKTPRKKQYEKNEKEIQILKAKVAYYV